MKSISKKVDGMHVIEEILLCNNCNIIVVAIIKSYSSSSCHIKVNFHKQYQETYSCKRTTNHLHVFV